MKKTFSLRQVFIMRSNITRRHAIARERTWSCRQGGGGDKAIKICYSFYEGPVTTATVMVVAAAVVVVVLVESSDWMVLLCFEANPEHLKLLVCLNSAMRALKLSLCRRRIPADYLCPSSVVPDITAAEEEHGSSPLLVEPR